MQFNEDSKTGIITVTPDTQEDNHLLQIITTYIRKNETTTEFKPQLARSSQWPRVRQEWLHAHPQCAACGTTTNLEVHHIKPYHLHPEHELDPTNLITLCEKPSRNCHLTWGHYYNWQTYNPDVTQMTTNWNKTLNEHKTQQEKKE